MLVFLCFVRIFPVNSCWVIRLFIWVCLVYFGPSMAASSVASPLCTWLVAACMSVACDKDHPLKSSMFQTPKRLSRWAKRRLQYCHGGVDSFSSGWISSFYGISIHSMMSSCLAFEPCEAYSSSKGLSLSLTFFGDNGFSLFGSKPPTLNHRQRRLNRAAHSGNNSKFFWPQCFLFHLLLLLFTFSFIN